MSAEVDLRQLFLDRLVESGLTEKTAKVARFKALSAAQTAALWKGAPKQPSLKIPYLDPKGKDTDFYRIRLLGGINGFAHQMEKPLRYLQPPSSGIQVYFPKVDDLDWMQVLANPEAPIIITEGEIKALAASLVGLPTLGLGGVDSWRSKATKTSLIRDLEAIPWKGRKTYICYDSDVSVKPQVADAARRLAEELGSRGARVYDAGLVSPDGSKVGLDDFIVRFGVDALVLHLQEAPEFKEVQELHKFNSRFVFIRAMAQIYEETTCHFYDSNKFMNAVEANAIYQVVKPTPNGGMRTEKRSVAKDWIMWPSRRTVQAVNYVPGSDNLIHTDKNGTLELNVWRGWGALPKKGNIDPWRKLFRYLTGGESDATRQWFERWLAYPLQKPGAKLYTAVAMWGAQTGTGKTLLGETMIRIYGSNGQRIGAKQLSSAYNSWAQRKQFIMGDEITGNDSRGHADELKGLLTGEWIRINEKYQPEYDLPNCVNFYFTSNHPDAFFLDDYDRRFLILEAPDVRMVQEEYTDYHKWLYGEGPSALFDYLLRVDLGDFDPRAPALRTRAHEIMVESNRSDVGRFITLVITDPEQAKHQYMVPKEVELFSARELLLFYDPRKEKKVSEKAVIVELQKQGALKVLGGAQIRVPGKGRARLYAVREMNKWRDALPYQVKRELENRVLPNTKF